MFECYAGSSPFKDEIKSLFWTVGVKDGTAEIILIGSTEADIEDMDDLLKASYALINNMCNEQQHMYRSTTYMHCSVEYVFFNKSSCI